MTYTFERPNRALIRFGDIIVARAIQEDAARYAGLTYWDYNWRKGGGAARMIEISKRESFYQQEYCGCVYSLRDSNHHRRSQGRAAIAIGTRFYGNSEPGGD